MKRTIEIEDTLGNRVECAIDEVKTELENSKAQVVILKGRKVFTLSKLQEIVDLIQHENFSIIHTHLMYANIIGNLIAFIFHKPVVTTLHNTLAKPNKSTGRLLQKIENFIFEIAY